MASSLRIRWLGTACFVVETDGATLVLDPFVSRPRVTTVAFRKLVPDATEMRRYFPSGVDAVVCGHSHYDHLLDGPALAAATGAKFVGSATAIHIARAAGVPQSQLVTVTRAGAKVPVGDVELSLVPSLHGRFVLRRFYLADGELAAPPKLPAHALSYKMGGAFGLFVRAPAAGLSLYHNGSADLIDAELSGMKADVLLVGLAGRHGTRDYLARLVRALEPKVIVPTHHDAFFAPLGEGMSLLPGIDLDGFVNEAKMLAPHATIVLPAHLETVVVPPNDPRGAGLVDVLPASRTS